MRTIATKTEKKTMRILNLTQHAATPEQIAAGVYEPKNKAEVQRLLTFDTLPTEKEVLDRAVDLAVMAFREKATAAMIGGAPFLMAPLQELLGWRRVKALYAFSERRSQEQTMPDGTVRKVNVFKHVGFVESV